MNSKTLSLLFLEKKEAGKLEFDIIPSARGLAHKEIANNRKVTGRPRGLIVLR